MIQSYDRRIDQLQWVQPKRRNRYYELQTEDAVVASIEWESLWRSRAVCTTAEGQRTVERRGAIRPTIVIRALDSEVDLAVFRGGWDGGGTLELRDGRTYTWAKTNWWHTAWAWTDRSGQPLLRFKGDRMTVEPVGASLPDLLLLASLTWYLNITRKETNSAAGVVVTTTVV